MVTSLAPADISAAQFQKIAELLYSTAGITLVEGKTDLVKARLAKRLRTLDMASYDEYLGYLSKDGSRGELMTMVDALTTNTTSFFREEPHFELLKKEVLPALIASGRKMRFWSAGCSSGEEPYTLAMVLLDALTKPAGSDIRILATDISGRVLAKARESVYPEAALERVPAGVRARHFRKLAGPEGAQFAVKDAVKNLVTFARLNLIAPWPMQGRFDVIFCRNVMIYFDLPTRSRLVQRFQELLAPGGYLLIGHSESLTNMRHGLSYVQPAVYRRETGPKFRAGEAAA